VYYIIFEHRISGITLELTGRGDYIQPSVQSIKLRKRLSALRSNDLFDGRRQEPGRSGTLAGSHPAPPQ
jgi:hypothetical protein